MAQDDFDIERLAAYLHMMPAAVMKLAERGKLPGRRVGGEWRFSAPEIHHWLEGRIGLSDDEAEMHSTALDNGVALLHPRRPMPAILAEAVLALGITPGGIPFGSGGSLTDIFFLICSTSDHEHLRILARLSRVIKDHDFLSALRCTDDPAAIHQLIRDRETAIRAT
jgi:mannitol/fructose-specific phosphotransferase system IIA component